MKEERLNDFRLVGGTALALQIGHRTSVDIDLFTDHSFDPNEVLEALRKTITVNLGMNRPNGMQLTLDNIKVDIYNWALPFIEPPVVSDGLRLASVNDIAAFKLDAVTTRKTKKDFYDIHFLLKKMSFEEMISVYQKKYPYNDVKNVMTAMSSCAVADKDIQPELLEPAEWEMVKTSLINEVKQYEKDIIVRKKEQAEERERNIKKLM